MFSWKYMQFSEICLLPQGIKRQYVQSWSPSVSLCIYIEWNPLPIHLGNWPMSLGSKMTGWKNTVLLTYMCMFILGVFVLPRFFYCGFFIFIAICSCIAFVICRIFVFFRTIPSLYIVRFFLFWRFCFLILKFYRQGLKTDDDSRTTDGSCIATIPSYINGPFPFQTKFWKKSKSAKISPYCTLKEHPTFTKIAKFGCKML